MNCKQGDMAYVVGCCTECPCFRPFLGHVVKCGRPETDPYTGEPGWIISPPLPDGTDGVADNCLRPIKDFPEEESTPTEVFRSIDLPATV